SRGALPAFTGAAWVYGFGGSIVSAISVALWVALQETHQTLHLWRYLNPPEPIPAPAQRVETEQTKEHVPTAEIRHRFESAERPPFDDTGAARWGLWTRDGDTALFTRWGLLHELSKALSNIVGDANYRTTLCEVIVIIEGAPDKLPHVIASDEGAT